MSSPHVCCAVEHGVACCNMQCIAIATLIGRLNQMGFFGNNFGASCDVGGCRLPGASVQGIRASCLEILCVVQQTTKLSMLLQHVSGIG